MVIILISQLIIKIIIDDVISAVNEGTKLRVDGREGRRTVALLEAIYNSARAGQRLTL